MKEFNVFCASLDLSSKQNRIAHVDKFQITFVVNVFIKSISII